MFEPQDLQGFLKIFTFSKKQELEKYSREVTVYFQDLALFILACEGGRMPFAHRIHYRDYIPEHLKLSKIERKALTKNGVGPIQGDALKAIRKIGQLFKERRYSVGHIFYTPNLSEWHLFYFDQRDLEERSLNHWKGGSHIHFINYLWPEHDAQSLWSKFVSGNIQLGRSFHIRFICHDLQEQNDIEDEIFRGDC